MNPKKFRTVGLMLVVQQYFDIYVGVFSVCMLGQKEQFNLFFLLLIKMITDGGYNSKQVEFLCITNRNKYFSLIQNGGCEQSKR